MGSTSYPPKYYNPNWGQYSRKRKLWEANEKRKEKYRNSSNNNNKKNETKKNET